VGKVSRGSVLVVDQDELISQSLARELGAEGFSVRTATTVAEALRLIGARVPDAIVTETILSDGTGFDLVEQVHATPAGRKTRALILGSESNFLEKVQAIRCGADAYFEKQLDSAGVARRLRSLLDKPASSAQRILSVEDDSEQAEFFRAVLETAGYHVQVCSDPARFEQDLISFRPDLILMDILLPKVSGYDLARYLRQHEAYSTLPILFLTSDAQARVETMRAGGDDHLTKPISPSLLLAAISQRLERATSVQRLIDRDGLTGLLTHSAFQDRSRGILNSCRRFEENRAALVMLDIDHFKLVNDRYGHAVGDRVLASFAALLRRNVRNTDVVGRYGGDEFAFILNDLAQVDAERIVNRLSSEFSTLAHRADDGTLFRATFSAGIAMAGSAASVEDWKKAADEAMYLAKHAGRNQVRAA
jgi:diguanylate cyclase (GGDEF)-like protein